MKASVKRTVPANQAFIFHTKRGHTGEGMNDGTPYQKLQKQYYWITKDICAFPPLLLDNTQLLLAPGVDTIY